MNDERDARISAAGAVATVGAAIAAFYPELGVPAAGAAGALAPIVDNMVVARFARYRQVEEDLRDAALGAAGIPDEEFLNRVAANPRLLATFERIVRACVIADSRARVRALGRCLGNMVGDEALIDPELVWVWIHEQIDRQHVKILIMIRELQDSSDSGTAGESQIYRQSGLGDLILTILVVLENCALIRNQGGSPSENAGYRTTELAAALIRRYEDAANGPEEDWS
jgi:hypothetical protein